MQSPLIYILCTSQRIGRLAIEVDAHVRSSHPALRYVTDPHHLEGAEGGAFCIDLLDRGQIHPDWADAIREHVAARQLRVIATWKLKMVLRALNLE